MKKAGIRKALLALLLSSAIIFTVTIPAFALTGTINYQTNNNVLGVKESCTGHFDSSNARSTIILTFLPNSVHPPEEDFWCYTIMDLHESNAFHHYAPAGGHMSCDTGLKSTAAMTIIAAEFYYSVNDVQIYSQTF